jgi:hypothetical protein
MISCFAHLIAETTTVIEEFKINIIRVRLIILKFYIISPVLASL